MMKSITRTMLMSTMSFAWTLTTADERTSEATKGWGSDQHASVAEVAVRNAGRAITAVGERLEQATNALAMRLGYRDGEVSGRVAWPELTH